MWSALLKSVLGSRLPERSNNLRADGGVHVYQETWPAAIYAVGDIHGCLAQLVELEQLIVKDAVAIPGKKIVVYLGDYVDRGPNSAGVIDRLMVRPTADFTRICLAGNHEAMAMSFLQRPHPKNEWLDFGGRETLESYGIELNTQRRTTPQKLKFMIESHIPNEHIAFLGSRPLSFSVPGAVFVHAGLKPELPLERQEEKDMLWIREEFSNQDWSHLGVVVHGHTPTKEPIVSRGRICVDTGAYATGVLTAVRLTEGGGVHFLKT